MADTQELEPKTPASDEVEAPPAALSTEWIDRIEALLEAGSADELREHVVPLPPADVADLIEALSS